MEGFEGLSKAFNALLDGLKTIGYIALAIILILVALAFFCGLGAGVFLRP